jgi:hypothetical protein
MKRLNRTESRLPRGCSRIVNWMLVAAAGIGVAGCKRETAMPESPGGSTGQIVRGSRIDTRSSTNAQGPVTNAPFVPADYSRPDRMEGGVIQLGWDKLSGFKFDVYEVYSETNSGRALIRSDDSIPAPMKAYDGRQVAVTGFMLPLRTRKGRVTEFLLLRDQGSCCFGPQAQINHFMRVNYPAGIQYGDPVPWKATGTIRVGEIYIQGYLTGIYQLEAESVAEVKER